MRDNPDWPGQGPLQAHAELVRPLDLPANKVLAWFQKREPMTFGGAMQLVRALQASGEKSKAAEAARRAWVELDGGGDEEKYFLDKCGALLKSDDYVARLDRPPSG